MSNEIKCKNCGFENPHSSKFCNNCGAKLPLSTHIICPNCETPNTRDRIFCDTCGTRLVPDTSQLKPEEPEESPPTPSEPFSLPARRPGDTGELHPHAVPDWLRTGDIGSTKDAEDTDESEPEEPEEKKKSTSDLPDWLVHDSDPEPIINAPTTISTEFYQDLLDKAEDLPQPDDLFADEEAADLPDWLSEADEPSQVADTSADDEAGTRLTGWLSDLRDEETEEDTAVPEQPEDDVSSGLTDWLHELDDLGGTPEDHTVENAAALDELLSDQPIEEDDDSDWLQELGPAQTDVFPRQTDEPDEEAGEELPGWMDELGPLQTNLLDPNQIAELTGPLTDLPEDDLIDDEDAGADASFTDLFETATGSTTDDLPDWLDTAAADVDSFLEDLPDEPAEEVEPSEATSDWFGDDLAADDTDLDWLSEPGDLEAEAGLPAAQMTPDEDTAEDAFAFEDDLAVDDEDAEEAFDLADLAEGDDDFAWLSDMEAIETGELVIEPESEGMAIPDEQLAFDEEEQPDEAEPGVTDEAQDDTWTSDTFFAETAVGEDLPDWLNQLDQADETAETSDVDAPDEEMPEWIASMRPSQGMMGSELPSVFPEMDLRDTLEGIPEELAGAELPEWLQDTPLDEAPPSLFEGSIKEEPMEIPDWLQPGAEESDSAVPTPGAPMDQPEAGSSRDEWRSLLDELPPLTPLAESLPKADIPEWVQQLKPPELTGEPPREPEGPEEISGPLKGMHGIVAIEPAIAKPRLATLPTPYVTTPEQQQQVALLQQLTQESPETVTTLATKPAYDTAVWLRVVLAILLIAAVLVGLRGPSIVAMDGPVPANVQAVETAVSAAAGRPVLLAVEYTPAMAGELTPQAELLLTHLAANGSPVLITSQYAAGTAVANNLAAAANPQMIGYVPGESIGLRQLGDCLGGRNECEQLNGRLLDTDLQADLSQVGLIIVLTGDRDNLVNWIEQVGSVAEDVPIVAGVTQALTPLANGYAATGQLSGLLGGAPDAAAYEQLVELPASGVQTHLNAQIFGQLLAGLLLLVGLLTYGTRSLASNRRQKR